MSLAEMNTKINYTCDRYNRIGKLAMDLLMIPVIVSPPKVKRAEFKKDSARCSVSTDGYINLDDTVIVTL